MTEVSLKEWLKIPFKILEHRAGIRPLLWKEDRCWNAPASTERWHIEWHGTKGCS